MELTTNTTDKVLIIQINGEVDHLSRPVLMQALVDAQGHERIDIDISGVQHIGSAFVDVLVTFRNRFADAASRARIVGTLPQALDILQITGITKIYPVMVSSRSCLEGTVAA